MRVTLILVLFFIHVAAIAQTDSRITNTIHRLSNQYLQDAQRVCNAHADANEGWQYYRGKYLNDCYQIYKMNVLKRHENTLAQRIQRLAQRARDRRDQGLMVEVQGLQQGLEAHRTMMNTERERYVRSCYRFYGLNETTEVLQKHVVKYMKRYLEMRMEMQREGTLR